MEKRVSVRISATGDAQVKAAFAGIGREGTAALQQVEQGSRRMGPAVQNAAFQIGDFAVQVASGTSATRAMAQQLPQLLGGFGVMGAVAGAAAAILVPFAGRLFETGDNAEGAQEQIKEFAQALDDYRGYVATAAATTSDLTQKFGEFAGQIRTFADYLADLAAAEGLEKAAASLEPLKTGLDDLLSSIADQTSLREAFEAMQAGGIATAEQLLTARQALELLDDEVAAAAARLGLLPDEARALAAAIDEIDAAETMAEVAEQAAEALDMIRAIYPSAEDIPGPLREAAKVLDEMARGAAAAANEAGRLAGNLAAAARLQSAQQQLAADGLVYSGRGGDPRTSNLRGRGEFGRQSIDDIIAEADRAQSRVTRGCGGGGGRSAETEMAREAKKVFEETRTEAERYATELERLNELYRAGAIDTATYERAQDQLKERFEKQNGLLRDTANAVKSGLSSVFQSIFEGSDKAIDAVANLGKELAALAAEQAFMQLLARLLPGTFGEGGFLANADGNAFSGGRVTAFATGGVVSSATLFPMRGGMGLMGEAGPEAILPLQRVGGRLGVSAAGGPAGVIIQNFDQRGAGAPIETKVQKQPDGRVLVTNWVRDDMARGRFDSVQRRFGAQPALTKR